MNENFTYTYSAENEEELKKIVEKYRPTDEKTTLMDEVRRLDKSVPFKGTITSIIVGILGTMTLGIGMSMIFLGSGGNFVAGIIVGFIGICIISAAYPVYKKLYLKEKERVAPQILSMVDAFRKIQ